MNSTLSRQSTLIACAFLGGTAVGYSIFRLLSLKKSKDIWSQGAEVHLWKIAEYSLTGALIAAGDNLDIYNKLFLWGPISSADLAAKAGWSERWTREFLYQATGAGFCIYKDGKFSIRPEYAKCLRGPLEEKKSLAGLFQFMSALVRRSDAVVESVKTGLGIDYDFGEKDVCSGIERKNKNFFRFHLIDEIIAKITLPRSGERLLDVLEKGTNVADIGCGCGTSTIIMAKRFPKSHFYAYESSPRSIRIMEEDMKKEGITNITICSVPDRLVGDGPDPDDPNSTFGFVYAHDVLHDMTNPRGLIQDVKKRLSKDGCWVIVDILCGETPEENLSLPNAATLFGFSCLLCLASSTSEPNGEGLGTCGFPPARAKRWMRKAGFQHFEQRGIAGLPYNSCYIVA